MPNQLAISSAADTYPQYTMLLGIRGVIESAHDNYSNKYFYNVKITDKINTIPSLTLTLHNLGSDDLPLGSTLKSASADSLKGVHIRIYKDGKKVFSGDITVCDETYNSGEIAITAAGSANVLNHRVIENIKDIENTASTEILTENFTYGSWSWEFDVSNDFHLSWRIETGNYLSHINAICVINMWEWEVIEEDAAYGLSSFIVRIVTARGSSIRKNFTFEDNSFNPTMIYDPSKVVNLITLTGGSSQASNISTQAVGFFDLGDSNKGLSPEMGEVISNESYLTEALSSNNIESMAVADVTEYPQAGTVMIDDELIQYTGKTNTSTEKTLTGLTRGDEPADHDPDTPVLMVTTLRVSLPATMTGTEFWIGNELVAGLPGPGQLNYVYRGYRNTPKYAHRKGTKIYSGKYSLSIPHPNSSISLNGRVDKSLSVTGPVDRDTLDKYGASLLLATQKFTQFGSFFVALDDLQGIVVGDYLNIFEDGSTVPIVKRCTGIVLTDDIAEIIFGLNEEWVFTQFDDITATKNLATSRSDKTSDVEVEGLSDNDKAVQITYNGTSRWVRLI